MRILKHFCQILYEHACDYKDINAESYSPNHRQCPDLAQILQDKGFIRSILADTVHAVQPRRSKTLHIFVAPARNRSPFLPFPPAPAYLAPVGGLQEATMAALGVGNMSALSTARRKTQGRAS